MVNRRIHPKTKDRFKRAIRDVISGLGRQVCVYKPSLKSECPNCFFDKMTGTSTGKCKWTPLEARQKQLEYEASTGRFELRYKFFKVGRCPVCKNNGFLEAIRKVWVQCTVNWDTDSDSFVQSSAGLSGNTYVELKSDPKYLELFNNCTKINIDGLDCFVSSPPILRGLGNQSVLVVKAYTNQKSGVSDKEILKDYK